MNTWLSAFSFPSASSVLSPYFIVVFKNTCLFNSGFRYPLSLCV
ncbi:hypothetical protein PRUB_b0424 [Pseudoalteromonas rubra]|uniref:Uncharacterized protein n=1 Tax=Pseudoalteromonas rubra TaxID=43658 RepID=A0A8T0C0V3_9GAMM|nr:hypothetical protein PRUB_b0424 [Pseudoalteromonas rubra]